MQWKKSTMAAGHVIQPLWGHTPGNEAYNNHRFASLNLEKTLIITINMTISACCVDDDVRRRCNDNESMGIVQPAG